MKKNDKEKLHSDLLSDLVEWKIPDTRFFFWNSLKSFIDKYAKTKFELNTAKTIKELRESIGMSRKEFSEHTGIPVRTLEDWEAGRRTPPE